MQYNEPNHFVIKLKDRVCVKGNNQVKRRIFNFIIILSLFSILNISVYAAESTSGIFKYELLSDGTAKITGFSGNFSGALTIPYKLSNGIVVKSVGAGAFRGNHNITKLTIEPGIKTISSQAFRACSSITDITIHEGVTSLGEYAFSGCNAVKTMVLPASLTSIDYNSLGSLSSLVNIDVADSNSKFLDYNGDLYTKDRKTLLRYCSGKAESSFVVPSEVTVIGPNAFNDSDNLESITLSSGLKSIQINGLADCSSLQSINLPKSLQYIGDRAFNYCTAITEITIPANVQSLGVGVFGNCTGLRQAFFSEGVDVVGESMFYNCTNLRWVSLPKSLEEIYPKAFLSCEMLRCISYAGQEDEWKKITISDENDNLKTVDLQFYVDTSIFNYRENTDETVTITSCSKTSGEIVMPDYINGMRVSSIDANAFYGSRITSVVLPKHLENIYASAFEYCYGLTYIICPADLRLISTGAFSNCVNLKNVELNEGLLEIGAYAFQGCTSLREIDIPSTVSNIRDFAFTYSTALENINVNSKNTSFSSMDGVLLNKSQTTLIQYPMAKRGAFYTVPESVTTIGRASFYNSNVNHVYLSDKIKFINNEAFKNSLIQSIRLPKSIVFILNDAFLGCSQLKEVYIAKERDAWSGITINTGNSALTGAIVLCYSVDGAEATITQCVTSAKGVINIPKKIGNKSIIAIGDSAFQDCVYVTEINLPLSIRSIGASAFGNCTLLSSINIPENVEFIGNDAFFGCDSLNNDVYYGGNENEWSEISFNTSLTSTAVSYNCIYKSRYVKVFREKEALSIQIIPKSELVGKEIAFAAYKDNRIVNLQISQYKDEAPSFSHNSEYDEIKIMVWSSLRDMTPMMEADGYSIDEL